MNESEFENELRGLRPAGPSLSLECRIAAAFQSTKTRRRPWSLWLAERLLWTAGGVAAAWLLVPWLSPPPAQTGAAPVRQVEAVPLVSEEPLAWSDEGVQLVDGGTPARMLRRLVMERHQSADGSAELRIPREDVILLPVALR